MFSTRIGDTKSGIARRHAATVEAGVQLSGRATGTSQTPQLRRGVTGQAVRELQRKLQKLGYLSAADAASGPGVFGPRTARAVMDFQVRHGLKRTGVVGQYTQAALVKALEQAAPSDQRTTERRVAIARPANSTFNYRHESDDFVPTELEVPVHR